MPATASASPSARPTFCASAAWPSALRRRTSSGWRRWPAGMDRELLLEIGCEELPASWLPGLTNQVGEVVVAALAAHRLPPESPAETFSTPRRLTARIARGPERQPDLEELVNGPPVAAAFAPGGTPTPAAVGFAARHGAEVS